MGIRRFNYTGRRKVRREDAILTLVGTPSGPAFEATLDLADYELPADSRVVIEAYRQTQVRRYRFGTAERPGAEEATDLRGLPDPTILLFRVKVIDAQGKSGRLLALADRLPLNDVEGGQRPSLVHVREDDLDGELWRLEYPDDAPMLLIERRHGPKELLLAQPHFKWLVLPHVFRDLLRASLENADDDGDEEELTWRQQIVRQGIAMARSVPPDDDDDHATESWITAAVKGFCRQNRFAERFALEIFPGSTE
jgi:hypothetical protein